MKLKHSRYLIIRLIIILLTSIVLLTACGTPVGASSGRDADLSKRLINVVATTGQVADLVRNVGGERVEVTTLMGPGVDPHLYKASARDVITIDSYEYNTCYPDQ
jgi:manganese/zinc/iron transport system substrate-binding protein